MRLCLEGLQLEMKFLDWHTLVYRVAPIEMQIGKDTIVWFI